MTRRWKIVCIIAGGLLIATTPATWILIGPNAGQLVAATSQVVVALVAIVVPLLIPTTTGPRDRVARTGKAEAADGGRAMTGVRRAAGTGTGSASAERTGDATADGPGSSASTGVDYT